VTRSGSMSEASEDDVMVSLADADDVLNLHRSGRLSSAPTGADTTADRTVSFDADDVSSSAATLPSHVKLVVTELESRYSTSAVSRSTHPPPALQTCPKITALRDTLLSRVQDPGPAKPSSTPGLENAPKVTAVRDGLIARVHSVPESSKASTPTMLQTSAKITALRETLISRVQDPGSSQWVVQRDLVDCPSVASRQTALMDAVAHKHTAAAAAAAAAVAAAAAAADVNKTCSLPRSVEFKHSDLTHPGLTNSSDGPASE